MVTAQYGQHNTIVSTLAKCLDELSINHQVEPRNRYADSENRPDIVAYDPDGHTTTDLDISMAHPYSGDTLRLAALKSGYAAEMREQRKVKKYGQHQSQSRTHTPCILLVFNILVSGVPWLKKFGQYIQEIEGCEWKEQRS